MSTGNWGSACSGTPESRATRSTERFQNVVRATAVEGSSPVSSMRTGSTSAASIQRRSAVPKSCACSIRVELLDLACRQRGQHRRTRSPSRRRRPARSVAAIRRRRPRRRETNAIRASRNVSVAPVSEVDEADRGEGVVRSLPRRETRGRRARRRTGSRPHRDRRHDAHRAGRSTSYPDAEPEKKHAGQGGDEVPLADAVEMIPRRTRRPAPGEGGRTPPSPRGRARTGADSSPRTRRGDDERRRREHRQPQGS